MHREATPLAIAIGAAAFAATFFASATADVPLVWFDPLRTTWSFGHRPSTVAIDWYGRTLLSTIAWAIAGGSTLLLVPQKPRPATLRVAMGWLVVAFAFAAGLYAFALWNRRAAPEPLPSWYEPR